MKKSLLLFLAALTLSFTAQAKVTVISPDAENDALRLAVHYAANGDTIEMTEGTYVQCNNNYVAFDGKSVTVKAAKGANVVLQLQVPITIAKGGKATLQGIKIDASRLTELANWYEHVIYASDTTGGKELVMEGCELYGFNINKSAIYSSSSNKLALCDVKNCYFHDNMKSCFFFEGESLAELSIINSTFANIATASDYDAGIIDVRNATAKVTIDHCTFYNCQAKSTDYGALKILCAASISNSIFMSKESQSSYRAIHATDGSNAQAINCLTFNYGASNNGIRGAVKQIDCIVADPLFVGAANGNFALAEDSPALGKATDGSNLGDPRWNAPAVEEPKGITYELNDGVLPAPAVPTNEELWIAFMPYYQEYYDVVRAEQPIASVAVFLSAGMGDDATIFTSEDSDYKWLGDYIIKVTTEQSAALTTLANWKFNAQAFFNANQYTGWPKSADFTEAGKPENWGPAYQAVHAVVLPTEPVEEDYVLPTPVKEGCTFKGWYDNAEGTGDAYSVIPAGWSGTLYAIWKQGTTTALENIAVEGKAVKTIINGQLIIIKNGVQYNALGQVIK